jgi:hypothetical protein
MNWFKRSQQVIDIEPGSDNYMNYGHDAYYDSLMNDSDDDFGIDHYENMTPNYMWVLINGTIDDETETSDTPAHHTVDKWRGINWGKTYAGRYDVRNSIVTVVPPREGVASFRSLPNALKMMLKRKFPDCEQIMIFGK